MIGKKFRSASNEDANQFLIGEKFRSASKKHMVFRDKNSELCLLRKTKSSDLKDIKSVFKNLEKWLLSYKRSYLCLRPKKMVF